MKKLITKFIQSRRENKEKRRKALMTWNGLMYFNNCNTLASGNYEVAKDKKLVVNLTNFGHMKKAVEAAKNR